MSSPKKFDSSFDGQSLALARWVAEMITSRPADSSEIHSALDESEAMSLLQELWDDDDSAQGPSKMIH